MDLAKTSSYHVATTLLQQLQHNRMSGAVCITGGRELKVFPDDCNLPRVGPDDKGFFNLVNGVSWQPNVDAPRVKFIIALQGDDTYSVYLWQANEPGAIARSGVAGKVFQSKDDVHFPELIDVVDSIYVAYLEMYQDGCFSI